MGQVGLLGGYNVQGGPWVTGLEGDIEYQGRSKVIFDNPAGTRIQDKVVADWTGHIVWNGGYDVQGWLFYAGGGFAFANVSAAHTGQIGPTTYFTWTAHGVRTGYDAMGGVAKNLGNGWSLRGEILYDYYYPKRYNWVPGERYSNIGLTVKTIRVGFSRRF
jgi:opacity protein-like surface antigen